MGAAALYGASKLKGVMDRRALIKGADANEGFGKILNKDYGPHKPSDPIKNTNKWISKKKKFHGFQSSRGANDAIPGDVETKWIKKKVPVDKEISWKGRVNRGQTEIDRKLKFADRQVSDDQLKKLIKEGDTEWITKNTKRKKGGILKARGGVEVKTKLNGTLYTQTF